VALKEVLESVQKSNACPHYFLHNYEETLWDQLLKLLPHRHVARLSIVSPYFEPNREYQEDPVQEDAFGIFERMFRDLVFEPPKNEKPVAVFFQQFEGKTLLPIDKLNRWKGKLNIFQRLSTTPDEPRPLHGKMLIIEGARGEGREPYLITVYGSANFTKCSFFVLPSRR